VTIKPTPTKPAPKPTTPAPVVVKPAAPRPAPPLSVAVPRTEPKQNRDMDALHADYRTRLDRFLADAKAKGFRVLVYETYRTPERQAWLYSQGRPGPHAGRPQVTWTLDSLHRYGLAADMVVLAPSGAADWSAAAYARLHAACPPAKYGLQLVAGEKPHLEIVGGQSYAAQHGIARDWRLA
jgi:LAS superfamily LD-carboxypeptidase LdcB